MFFEEEFPNVPMSIIMTYPSIKEYMEKNCLYKQRVKEVIENATCYKQTNQIKHKQLLVIDKYELIKGLGLDDEVKK